MLKKHSWCKATASNGLQWAFERILPERLVTDHPEDRRARDLARRVQWRRSGITPDEVAGLVDGGVMRFFQVPDRETIEEMRAEREADGNGPGPRGGPSPGGGPGSGVPQNGSADWIEENCEKVPQELRQSDPEGEREEARRWRGPRHSSTAAQGVRRSSPGRVARKMREWAARRDELTPLSSSGVPALTL